MPIVVLSLISLSGCTTTQGLTGMDCNTRLYGGDLLEGIQGVLDGNFYINCGAY